MFNRDKHREKRESERLLTEEFNRKRKEANFEKGDLPALIFAALTTIVPIVLLFFFVLWFLTMLFFRFFR